MKKILLFLCAIFFTTGAGSTGIGANDTTASCDDETLGQTSGTANIEVDWQPNTIDISWYSDNVLLSVQSSAQSCVYDDDLYLPAQPTKTGYTFKGWQIIGIPADYTRLEYIESTGTQWIDTGISDNDLDYIELDFQNKDTKGFVFANGSTQIGIKDERYGTTTPNTRYFITENKRPDNFWQFTNKNNGTTFTNYFNYAPGDMYLFNLNYGSEQSYLSQMKIYRFMTSKQGKLIQYFIPVKRNSDNVLGMYDTVTGTFFTNAGTGTFVAGPVVH